MRPILVKSAIGGLVDEVEADVANEKRYRGYLHCCRLTVRSHARGRFWMQRVLHRANSLNCDTRSIYSIVSGWEDAADDSDWQL